MELLFISDFISDLLKYINPEFILTWAGNSAVVVLFIIIFAETGLLIGFFLPGDSLLFLAGVFTATGHILPGFSSFTAVLILIAILIVAAVSGDQFGYLLGRKVGPAIFDKPKSKLFNPEYVKRTQDFYDRHGGKALILGRFVPIIRTFVPMVAGIAQLEYKLFVSYNVIGGIVWITSMTLLGYFLGEQFKDQLKLITIGIILISVIPVFITVYKEYKRKK